jgi:hypothetical protein
MMSDDLDRSLPSLWRELVYGAPAEGTFILNPKDVGLLASLDGLSASEASTARDSGATIAAHVEHLRFGLSLLNRWAGGEDNPFHDADWTAAWRTTMVDDHEWPQLRAALRSEAQTWEGALQQPRRVTGRELDGVIGSVIHLAYHFGAIRQIAPRARGPRAGDAA